LEVEDAQAAVGQARMPMPVESFAVRTAVSLQSGKAPEKGFGRLRGPQAHARDAAHGRSLPRSEALHGAADAPGLPADQPRENELKRGVSVAEPPVDPPVHLRSLDG